MPRQTRRPATTAPRLLLALLLLATDRAVSATLSYHRAGEYLREGDSDMAGGDLRGAISSYSFGMQALPRHWSKLMGGKGKEEDERLPTKSEIKDIINLHTHYGEAQYSQNEGVGNEEIVEAFKRAIVCYRDWLRSSPEYYRDDSEVKQAAARPFFFLGAAHQDLADRPEHKEEREEHLELAQKYFSQVKELDEKGDWTKSVAKSYLFLGFTYQELSGDSTEKEKKEAYLKKAVEVYDTSIELDRDDWQPYASKGEALAAVGTDEKGNGISLQKFNEGISTWETALYILKKGDPEGFATPTSSPAGGHKTENPNEVAAELLFLVGQALIPSLFEEPPADDGNEKEEKDDQGKGYEDLLEKMCKLPGEDKEENCLDLAVEQFQTALKFHPEHEGAKRILAWFQLKDNEAKMAQLSETMRLMEEYQQMKRMLDMMKRVEGLAKMVDELKASGKLPAGDGGEGSAGEEGEGDAKDGEEGASGGDEGGSPDGGEEDAASKDEL